MRLFVCVLSPQALAYSISLSHTQIYSHTVIHTNTQTYVHTHTTQHSQTHTLCLYLWHTLSHTHNYAHTHAHIQSHTHTHTVTHTHLYIIYIYGAHTGSDRNTHTKNQTFSQHIYYVLLWLNKTNILRKQIEPKYNFMLLYTVDTHNGRPTLTLAWLWWDDLKNKVRKRYKRKRKDPVSCKKCSIV